MRLLVTGGAGFIGRNFLQSLPADWEVCAPYRSGEDFITFLRSQVVAQVTAVMVDLADPDALARVGAHDAHWDACVYLAANGDPAVSVREPLKDLSSNAVALVNVLERFQFTRLVFFSSGAVYDRLRGGISPSSPVAPTLPYAISKFAAERYLHHFWESGRMEKMWVVRFFGAYGPYEPARKIYGRLVRQFALDRNPRFTVRGDGRNLVDAMYVDDAVRAIHLLLGSGQRGGVVDLSSHAPISLATLVNRAAGAFGLRAEITFEGRVPEYIQFHSIDFSMRDQVGFVPTTDLESGLAKFAEYLGAARPHAAHRQMETRAAVTSK
ncbi:MAG: NAD(P)-dependent oxidoreductase [Chloroflexi bacterium]|nr:NAD(P)-dependent oxidoreductase [Chloroflexota bacterium]